MISIVYLYFTYQSKELIVEADKGSSLIDRMERYNGSQNKNQRACQTREADSWFYHWISDHLTYRFSS